MTADDLPGDDELDPRQLAAMDSLATAVKTGEVSPEDAREIEVVIRRGHVHGARNRSCTGSASPAAACTCKTPRG